MSAICRKLFLNVHGRFQSAQKRRNLSCNWRQLAGVVVLNQRGKIAAPAFGNFPP